MIFTESFHHMCCEGKWLQNRLRADENKSRSFSAVVIQGHQREGFCIVPACVEILLMIIMIGLLDRVIQSAT